jgi:hypothetical protein
LRGFPAVSLPSIIGPALTLWAIRQDGTDRAAFG